MENNYSTICHEHYILNHLTIYKYRFNSGSNTFCNQSGREFSALCFITSGEVNFHLADGQDYHAGAGDIVFLPRGLVYSSFWTSSSRIEYYTIDFAFTRKTILIDTPQMTASQPREDLFSQSLLVIAKERVPDQLSLYFPAILTEYLTSSTSGSLLAVSDFYRLWQMILQLLTEENIPTSVRNSPVFAAIQYIEQNYRQDFGMADLAALCGLSESRFFNRFKACTGTTPAYYKNRLRIRLASKLLQSGNYSVAMVSDLMNFANPSYFRRVFRHYTGSNPKEYLKDPAQGHVAAPI